MSFFDKLIVYVPPVSRKPSNTVLEKLKQLNLIVSSEDTNVTVRCPFSGSKRNEHYARYVLPSEKEPYGKFECPKCWQRGISSFLNRLKISEDQIVPKGKIILQPSALDRINVALATELALGKRIFVCEETLVVVRYQNHEAIGYSPLQLADLRIEACRQTNFYRPNRRLVDPPENILKTVFSSIEAQQILPHIRGFIYRPLLRKTGDIVSQPGYDPQSNLFIIMNPKKFTTLQTQPSKSDAQKSLNELLNLLSEFPFATEEDRAAAVACLLTAVMRQELNSAPMFLVTAHSSGSGKSTFCELASIIATPHHTPSISFPTKNEEASKLLSSLLSTSPAVVHFDNVVGVIPALDSLCTCLTSSYIMHRILGTSSVQRLGTRFLMLANGNNVSVEADMTRRTLVIYLNSKEEIPAEKEFQNPLLLNYAREHREELITHILRIIQAWILEGSPTSPTRYRVVSFQDWQHWCIEPLLWLGLSDPLLKMRQAIREDPIRQELSELFLALQQQFGSQRFNVKNIQEALANPSAKSGLNEILEKMNLFVEKRLNTRSLGWRLKQNKDRIINHLQLEQIETGTYRIREIEN